MVEAADGLMRILHTSDWHLGRKLKEHDRSEEFRKFFEWLENVIVLRKCITHSWGKSLENPAETS